MMTFRVGDHALYYAASGTSAVRPIGVPCRVTAVLHNGKVRIKRRNSPQQETVELRTLRHVEPDVTSELRAKGWVR